MKKRVICQLEGSTKHTMVYRQVNAEGKLIKYNWEDDAVVGGRFYLCKTAFADRRSPPREVTVTIEYGSWKPPQLGTPRQNRS